MSTTIQSAVSLLSIGGATLAAQASIADGADLWSTLGLSGAVVALSAFFIWTISDIHKTHLAETNAVMARVAESMTKTAQVLEGLIHSAQETGTRVAALEAGQAAIQATLMKIETMQGGRK